MEYGYVRVSTREQNEDKQMVAIRKFGIAEDRIVLDKQSGKDFERPGYRRLTQRLRAGDTLVIKSHRPTGAELRGDFGAVAAAD